MRPAFAKVRRMQLKQSKATSKLSKRLAATSTMWNRGVLRRTFSSISKRGSVARSPFRLSIVRCCRHLRWCRAAAVVVSQTTCSPNLDAGLPRFQNLVWERRDRLDPDCDDRRRRGGQFVVHPSAWTAAGTLYIAFRSIGQLTPDAKALRTTRRELDAISCASLAARSHLEGSLRTLQMCLQASRLPWAFVGRMHDSTPIKLAFGKLQALAPLSRYWHQASPKSPAQLLTYDEWSASVGAKVPAVGIIDMLAQMVRIAWPERVGDTWTARMKDLSFPVRFMGSTNSVTLHAALETTSPSLSLDALRQLTDFTDFVVLYLGFRCDGEVNDASHDLLLFQLD